MKNHLNIAALSALCAAAGFLTLSCTKQIPAARSGEFSENNPGDKVELRVGVTSGVSTRAVGVKGDKTDEAKVNSLQVLVFRGDALDAYGTAADTTALTLSCTAGDRVVYALVNGQDMKDVQTKSALLKKVSKLSDCTLKSFEMIGVKDVTLPQTSTVSIDVNRFSSRVVLKKITNALTSKALQAMDFVVDDIYVTNVVGDCEFDRLVGASDTSKVSAYTPAVWYNKMKYEKSNDIEAFHHDSTGYKIAYESYKDTVHYFYAYPNPSEATTTDAKDFIAGGTSWSARRTKLVLKCHIGPDVYYYPIILPVIDFNKSYEINELKITRPGSDSEDTPVSFSDAVFSVNVVDWTTVLVSDINSGATDGTITI